MVAARRFASLHVRLALVLALVLGVGIGLMLTESAATKALEAARVSKPLPTFNRLHARDRPSETCKPSPTLLQADPNIQPFNKRGKEFFLDRSNFAPTGFDKLSSSSTKFPASIVSSKRVPWSAVRLPESLALHGVRAENGMPGLVAVISADDVSSSTPSTIRWLGQEAKPVTDQFAMYKQQYETTPLATIETGEIAQVPLGCFITLPEKGVTVYTVALKDGTTSTVATFPVIGPFGNPDEHGESCYPPALKAAFTLDGAMAWGEYPKTGWVECGYSCGLLQSFQPTHAAGLVWGDSKFQNLIDQANDKVATFGNYEAGPARLYNVFNHHSPCQKDCLVVGSNPNPWVEAIMYTYGAAHLTTSEYQVPEITGKFSSTFSSLHHEELLKNPKQFDMVSSFSSLEHDGLGRYHDPLSPGADLQQMRNLIMLTKPGGLLIVEVPIVAEDRILFNGARYYGPARYALWIEKWELVGLYGVGNVFVAVGTDPVTGGADKAKSFAEAVLPKNQREDEGRYLVSVLRKPMAQM
jgi:hypothetical protein